MNSCVVYILTALIYTSNVFRTANSNDCTPESCFPPTSDLETVRGASITANSTCGLNGNEEFCIKRRCGHQCNNAVPSNYHGVNLTIDKVDDDTYWKSKNLDENVFLELNLGHSYLFVEITATFVFNYPAAMYFSKSDDHGATWRTLAYFSSDCSKHFNVSAVEENDRNGFIVQCFRLDTANTELKVGVQTKLGLSGINQMSYIIVTFNSFCHSCHVILLVIWCALQLNGLTPTSLPFARIQRYNEQNSMWQEHGQN